VGYVSDTGTLEMGSKFQRVEAIWETSEDNTKRDIRECGLDSSGSE
jgi:hypothetical protein